MTKVRADLTAQELHDATLRFIDLMRACPPLYEEPEKNRVETLNSVECFLEALVAEDYPEPRRVA